ncbi:zinc-binding dehydrogenase [Kitasatospora sp. NPDC052868]|uniref:zinc-binding dehydrogenase n=1 Tax=Kitasatospora sp. NPDC052868 TaxID=3364060 RepID=UPI0037C62F11
MTDTATPRAHFLAGTGASDFPGTGRARADVPLHQTRWEAVPDPGVPVTWAVLTPSSAPSALAEELHAAHPAARQLPAQSPAGPPPGVLVVPADGAPHQALELVREVLASPSDPPGPRLVLVTRGAIQARTTDLAAGAEHGRLLQDVAAAAGARPGRFALVDLDAAPASLAALPAALGSAFSQLAVRAGVLLAPRSAPAPLLPLPHEHVRLALPGPPPWRLSLIGKGTLECLALDLCDEVDEPLTGRQVRIAVQAAGVNFRDVLDTLGLYPGDPGPLGAEGSGIVLDTGPDVATVRPGDRVMGLLTGAFGPIAVTDEHLLVPVPDGWPPAHAAAVPVAFSTASYGLFDLGRLTARDRILIHCATGGVGSAAVQLALHTGAEVFGTAGRAKHPALRRLGLDDHHIADSRSTDFEQQFLDATSGRGVDVVLNALAHEATDASLRLLRPGGRFVEMGKTDPRDPADIARDHPGVAYLPFDLRQAAEPQRLSAILHDLHTLFVARQIHPPSVHVFDVQDASAAFHHMSRARHVGKLVLRVPPADDARGGILLAGPLGDTVPLARHAAAAHGARHVWLVAHRNSDDHGAGRLQSQLAARSIEVHLVDADPCDPAVLRQTVETIAASAPLTAVVHTLADARPAGSTAGPGAAAALLHQLTRDLPLEVFLLAATARPEAVEDPDQGQAVLAALVRHRYALGLAATLIMLPPDLGPARPAALAQLFDTARHTDTPVLASAPVARPDGAAADAVAATTADQTNGHRPL